MHLPCKRDASLKSVSRKYQEAIGTLCRYVDMCPDDSIAWLYLGYLSLRMGRYDHALRYYSEAWRRDPQAREARERYLQLRDAIKYNYLPNEEELPGAA